MRSFAFSTRLSHALHQVRKQGCPSSQALSSPKGGSRREIADIPRFAAPPGGRSPRARISKIWLLSYMLDARPFFDMKAAAIAQALISAVA